MHYTAHRAPQRIPRKRARTHTRLSRHTHVRAVRLPSVDGMLPESWPFKYKSLQDTPTAIASHHRTHHTIAPDAARAPSQSPATLPHRNPSKQHQSHQQYEVQPRKQAPCERVTPTQHSLTAHRQLMPTSYSTSQLHGDSPTGDNATKTTNSLDDTDVTDERATRHCSKLKREGATTR
jgi:hypothetical protein